MYYRKISPVLILALMTVVAGLPSLSTAGPASTDFPDYFAIKGGYYYPSQPIRLDEFSSADFERDNGFNGEIAVGHYYAPFFGMEFGVGYFETRRFPDLGNPRATVEALPVLLSAKLFLPVGPVEPYAEIGAGAYFTRLEVDGALGEAISRDIEWGPHAGLGLNVNLTDQFYLGLEGRYRWVKPDFDGTDVRFDGYTATANLGFRY